MSSNPDVPYKPQRSLDIVVTKQWQTVLLVIIIVLVVIAVIVVFIYLFRSNTRTNQDTINLPSCTTDFDCTSSQVCNAADGTCVECKTDNNCPLNKPVCNTNIFKCVSCADGDDCPSNKPICNASNNSCVQCLNNTQCPASSPICNTVTNTCAACIGNIDCTSPSAPICNPSNNQCVECLSSATCGPLTCVNGVCCNLTTPNITGISISTAVAGRINGSYSYYPTPGLTELFRIYDNSGNFIFDVVGGAADGIINVPQNTINILYDKLYYTGFTYRIAIALSSNCGISPFSTPVSFTWPVIPPTLNVQPVIVSASATTSQIAVRTSIPSCAELGFRNLAIFASQAANTDPNFSFKIVNNVGLCTPNNSNPANNTLTTGSWVMPVSSGQIWYIRVGSLPGSTTGSPVYLSAPIAVTIA